MSKVLIIDDDAMICEMLDEFAAELGHESSTARNLQSGLDLAVRESFDVVFLDVFLPDGSGLDAVRKLRECPSHPEVIVVTGHGDEDKAEVAMRLGAWSYVEKPLTWSNVVRPLERALKYRREERTPKSGDSIKRDGIAGASPLIRAVLDTVALAADSDASVLISGETGTGKELIARAIHANSPRSSGTFVIVDCASLPENLVESILFGHVKGAFTGADKDREGLVKQADGGTLFLDEVGELPYPLQRSFLRVLEQRAFRPVGSKSEEQSDFRLVSATNRNLDEMVELKRFRKDLLFRIRSFHIDLPPLRERDEDIDGIVRHHLGRISRKLGVVEKDISPEFMDALRAYEWPGNVRELVNSVERAMAAAHNAPTMYLKHLPEDIRASYARTLVRKNGERENPEPGRRRIVESGGVAPTWSEYRERAMSEAEMKYFGGLLTENAGDVRRTCKTAGVSRARLYQILKKHGMSRNGNAGVNEI
jgi:DNA-binding NtrC family response regulator